MLTVPVILQRLIGDMVISCLYVRRRALPTPRKEASLLSFALFSVVGEKSVAPKMAPFLPPGAFYAAL